MALERRLEGLMGAGAITYEDRLHSLYKKASGTHHHQDLPYPHHYRYAACETVHQHLHWPCQHDTRYQSQRQRVKTAIDGQSG